MHLSLCYLYYFTVLLVPSTVFLLGAFLPHSVSVVQKVSHKCIKFHQRFKPCNDNPGLAALDMDLNEYFMTTCIWVSSFSQDMLTVQRKTTSELCFQAAFNAQDIVKGEDEFSIEVFCSTGKVLLTQKNPPTCTTLSTTCCTDVLM